ncbi:unnamed protein product [Clavelina lepadiformis]|uniref:Uncharacterized protein n=1 Tax=Clavelina lepadiformis TaxID=159417 RepID=A0ABP0FLL1_CLALP
MQHLTRYQINSVASTLEIPSILDRFKKDMSVTEAQIQEEDRQLERIVRWLSRALHREFPDTLPGLSVAEAQRILQKLRGFFAVESF